MIKFNRIFEYGESESAAEAAHGKDQDLGQLSRDQWERSVEQVETFITHHPATSVAVAVAVGVSLGWFLKR